MNPRLSRCVRVTIVAGACAALSIRAQAGQAANGAPPVQVEPLAAQQILEEIRHVRAELAALREQLIEERRDSETLRRDLAALRETLGQDQELLNAKVQEHEQTKIESGSKYNVRLSGLVLLNMVATRGSVDSLDLPLAARDAEPASGGSIGMSVRQSTIGLEVFGPRIGGARTSADVALDFFGGFPGTTDGLSAARPRLRTANVKLAWDAVSIAAGQDAPFFSPQSPTSLLATAYPAFSSSGNVWTWTPQVYVDVQRPLGGGAGMTFTGGLLDPFTGEEPPSEYDRIPTAGERSRVPAVAMRAGLHNARDDRRRELGAGAYYARQTWGFGRDVEAWAATVDWDIALGRWVAVSGEAYRGQALGGLGGGLSASVLFDGLASRPETAVIPVESTGGWFQLKVAPSNRLEFNGAWGTDRPSCSRAPQCAAAAAFEPSRMRRNETASLNTIYHVRSNVLVSLEYRRLRTTSIGNRRSLADHISLNTGIAF
jgi:hypothetical protein